MSHRVTFFLYLVPMDWTDAELDITIPAIEFLARRMADDGEMIDLDCVNDASIVDWANRVPDLHNISKAR
jgi:hypothetical protein